MSIADEFLNKHPFTTICDLPLITEVNKQVIIVGTIKGVDDNDEWYYLGCEECIRKVEPTLIMPDAENGNDVSTFKQVLVCSNKDCPKEVVSADPVFRITVRVQDCTGITSFTLFDREAKKLLGMSAMQLLEICKHVSGEDRNAPVQFKAFEEKKFAFKIKVGQFNIDKHLDGYAILKLTNDSSIIASLEDRFPDVQVEDGGSDTLDFRDSSTQNALSAKDSVSFMGDNTTSESSSKESLKTSSPELKRTLDVVLQFLHKRQTSNHYDVVLLLPSIYACSSFQTYFVDICCFYKTGAYSHLMTWHVSYHLYAFILQNCMYTYIFQNIKIC